MRNAEFGMVLTQVRNAECGVRNGADASSECGVRNSEWRKLLRGEWKRLVLHDVGIRLAEASPLPAVASLSGWIETTPTKRCRSSPTVAHGCPFCPYLCDIIYQRALGGKRELLQAHGQLKALSYK